MPKVHRTKNEKVINAYRFIPYGEISEVLKNDGEAFLEQDNERPLKRSTIWRASKKLSQMVGRKVRYDRSFLQIGETYLEGYIFSIEGQESPPPSGSDA